MDQFHRSDLLLRITMKVTSTSLHCIHHRNHISHFNRQTINCSKSALSFPTKIQTKPSPHRCDRFSIVFSFDILRYRFVKWVHSDGAVEFRNTGGRLLWYQNPYLEWDISHTADAIRAPSARCRRRSIFQAWKSAALQGVQIQERAGQAPDAPEELHCVRGLRGEAASQGQDHRAAQNRRRGGDDRANLL